MQLVEVLIKIEDSGKFLVDKLADLGPPLIVRANETHQNLFHEWHVPPLLQGFILAVTHEHFLEEKIAYCFECELLLRDLDFKGLKEFSNIWVQFYYFLL